ncbi:c-type cytochrome [Synechococcus sp. CS-1325]|uniref:c-type cytochrome n=1 Tax=unclassified Synechococcus TaxID=2626047 RepID=UPI000DB3E747|nr:MULTISPECIES: c-type cytochrome [unclassified Synechococcus]PZV01578.1 MAG: cytochrome C6 [Cyanobium sp.]MCT0200296.1 c-type cytochrome [Synechococcus sp. CS-1325]MCT0214307.1 c-type cytochrome [Synechococcus sp. CS-1326]MCT0230130.1 c-type cytochrome [Synechococcus sp. CS-1324]MCT0234471.1 c-type cytochrome [Synechococcus sp. CS-1327]
MTEASAHPWWRRLLAAAFLLALFLLLSWPSSAYGASGEQLFEAHCSGCHIHGGNILRRNKTLKLAALQRNGIEGPELIATIAAGGIGQMGGYAKVLGEDGPALVAEWVWRQALADWPRPAPAQKA